MKSIIALIFLTMMISSISASSWSKLTVGANGTVRGTALFYQPDSNRFIRLLGAGYTAPPEPYEVQMFTFSENRWVNFLPHDSLYGSAAVSDSLEALAGKWSDSTGNSYGNGKSVAKDYFGFYARQGYLRVKEGGIWNQYTYDTDAKKFYCLRHGRTNAAGFRPIFLSYSPVTRLWDTVGCKFPEPLKSTSELR
ncbi:MAG: hypothetical protein JNL74_06695 [Fibrobacteres bacterium]|nr:hypothetical protein [Fibrobacterota bacterium]